MMISSFSRNPGKCGEKRLKMENTNADLSPINTVSQILPSVFFPSTCHLACKWHNSRSQHQKERSGESGLSLDCFSRLQRLDKGTARPSCWLALCLRHTSVPQPDKEALKVSEPIVGLEGLEEVVSITDQRLSLEMFMKKEADMEGEQWGYIRSLW